MSEKPEEKSSVVKGSRGAYRDYNKHNDKNKHITHPKGFWDKNGKYRSGIKGRDGRQRKRCGAKTRSKDAGGRPCQRWAMKNGRCRLHGGKNVGAKKGNKMALKTGEYETIWYDVLEEEEVLFLQDLKLDVETQLDEELKLITVRERRMMQRIMDLKDDAFIVTERTDESEEGFGKGGAIDVQKRTRKREMSLKVIQSIEEALTRVQDKKAKLLELKLKVQATTDNDSGALDGLVKILEASRNRLQKVKPKPSRRKKKEKNETDSE